MPAEEVEKTQTRSASESENPAIPAPEPKTGGRPHTNQDWWPNQLDLSVLHQNSPSAVPEDRRLIIEVPTEHVYGMA